MHTCCTALASNGWTLTAGHPVAVVYVPQSSPLRCVEANQDKAAALGQGQRTSHAIWAQSGIAYRSKVQAGYYT